MESTARMMADASPLPDPRGMPDYETSREQAPKYDTAAASVRLDGETIDVGPVTVGATTRPGAATAHPAGRPDPRLPASWCREGVAHDHQACGTLWDSTSGRDIEAAARWCDDNPTVTSPVLLVEWLNDDYVRISLDGKTIMNVNSDDHGSDGMEAAITAAGRTALLLGARVDTAGVPNLEIKL